MNMVHLPSNADTFMVMPAFRAALGVECNFCHVFGDKHERGHADERHLDGNPKKIVARNMIGMIKEINATLFPQDSVDIVFAASSIVPDGKHYVTCYTCHRGDHVPPVEPIAASR
jgi:photosynthetic reaction center cytochrome c subunit